MSVLRDLSNRGSLKHSPSSHLSIGDKASRSPPGPTQRIRLQTVVAAEAVPEITLSSVKVVTDVKEMEMETTDVLMAAKDLQARGRAATIGRIRDLIPLRPLPVGGCLSPYWKIWQREGASPWTVEVLRVGYRLPFVEEPPLSLKPVD